MKTIVSILALAALLALCPKVHAQNDAIYAPVTLTNSAIVGPSAAVTCNNIIDVRKQKNVGALFLSTASSGTAITSFVFQYGVDGSLFGTNLLVIAISGTGTTPKLQTTNIDSLGFGYLKLLYITNADASATSTNTVQYALKIKAP